MKCVLKGLILYKSEKITFKTNNTMFYLIIQDENNKEMKICFFNDQIDKFYKSLYEDQTILLNKLKFKQLPISEISFNEKHFKEMISYEGTVTFATSIGLAKTPIQKKTQTLQQLSTIAENKYHERYYSFIGFINEINEIETIKTNEGEEKRWKFIFVDVTGYSIQVTIQCQCTIDILSDTLKKDSIIYISQ